MFNFAKGIWSETYAIGIRPLILHIICVCSMLFQQLVLSINIHNRNPSTYGNWFLEAITKAIVTTESPQFYVYSIKYSARHLTSLLLCSHFTAKVWTQFSSDYATEHCMYWNVYYYSFYLNNVNLLKGWVRLHSYRALPFEQL